MSAGWQQLRRGPIVAWRQANRLRRDGLDVVDRVEDEQHRPDDDRVVAGPADRAQDGELLPVLLVHAPLADLPLEGAALVRGDEADVLVQRDRPGLGGGAALHAVREVGVTERHAPSYDVRRGSFRKSRYFVTSARKTVAYEPDGSVSSSTSASGASPARTAGAATGTRSGRRVPSARRQDLE